MIQPNCWFAYPKRISYPDLRLFCFPYSGSGASLFRSWADILPAKIQVCPVQLPGREVRITEPPFTRLPPLVEALAQAIQPHLDRPFAFFGHSMGALVSFELARWLVQQGAPCPLHLFVSGRSAPHIVDSEPPIYNLPETEFVTKLRSLNGMSSEIVQNSELMALLVPILRADFAVCETYVYQAGQPLPCPITALGGLADPYVDRLSLGAWREHTNGTFTLRMFPGDHFYLNTQQYPLLRMLAQDLINHTHLS